MCIRYFMPDARWRDIQQMIFRCMTIRELLDSLVKTAWAISVRSGHIALTETLQADS